MTPLEILLMVAGIGAVITALAIITTKLILRDLNNPKYRSDDEEGKKGGDTK